MDNIKNEILASIEVKEKILHDQVIIEQINTIAQEALKCLKNGNKIILAGNGGSFADAQHISAEFISRYMIDRDSLPSICLGTNSSSISAIGNDYGYEKVFSRELSSLGQEGDIFIAISTSGNSNNIIDAIETALNKKIKTFVLTGLDGGKASELVECIKVPSLVTGRIQESHILIGHIVCGIIEKEYFNVK